MARGDQIYVMREFLNLKGVYEHHGIDCGDGTVIHYRKSDSTIARTSMTTFADGRPLQVRHYPVSYTPDATIARASSRLGEQQYNLLYNNCEHFATWCKTGVSESLQVKEFLPLLSSVGADNLTNPVWEAIGAGTQDDAPALVHKALGDVKLVWDRLQPQYNQAVQEMQAWDRVAKLALKQGREDLSKAAIQRKLGYKRQAKDLKAQLEQLAQMTENLTRNADLQFGAPFRR